jgi:hypothetical protein
MQFYDGGPDVPDDLISAQLAGDVWALPNARRTALQQERDAVEQENPGAPFFLAHRRRSADPADHRRLALLPGSPRCPAQRDYARPDGGAHCAGLDPSAVFKSQALGLGRLSRAAKNQSPALPW